MLKLPNRPAFKIPKIAYFVVCALVIVVCAFVIFKVVAQKRELLTTKNFLGLVSSNLISADQSLDEVVKSLGLVDANYKKISTQDASLKKEDYDVVISDNQKSLSQIESIRGSLKFQKELITNAKSSKDSQNLKIDFANYYTQADYLLAGLIDDFRFENSMLKVIAISANQGRIIQSDVWQQQDREEVIKYYKDLKNQAIDTIGQLSKVKVSEKYQNYFKLQNSYFEYISATADEVISILQREDIGIVGQDDPNQIERAYQTAFASQNTLSDIEKQITSERRRLLPLKVDTPDFEHLAKIQSDLELKIKELNQNVYKSTKKGLWLIF